LKLNKHYWFWIFTLAVILILIVSQLIQDGVFMDGMLYISVGKNLSDGIGTFWNQSFSKTSMFSYHEQPPLYGGLIALFYKVFGSSMYVERLFCFVCFSGAAIYISKLWKAIFKDSETKQFTWLPVLFFTSIPVVFWAYTNHVEETVMTFFALASVYYSYKALFNSERIVLNLVFAGVFVFLSSLTKGVQGLFPIAAVGFYWIVSVKNYQFSKMILHSLVLVGTPVLIYSLLFLISPEALESFKTYFGIRFVNTFNNVGATTGNRFELLIRLINELLPLAILSLLILILSRKQKSKDLTIKDGTKRILWFILIGLSGSMPLMVTLEQRGFYLVTALPYFALAFALLLAPRLTNLFALMSGSSLGLKLFKGFSAALLLASIVFVFTSIGETKRDKEMLQDVYTFGKLIPRGEIVSIPTEMWNDWNFQTYMVRHNYISLEVNDTTNNYFLIRKDLPTSLVPEIYHLINDKTAFINVYSK
jgi:4-amino-4-deoxy-L-arabinose transferase-like glycosyltransferase